MCNNLQKDDGGLQEALIAEYSSLREEILRKIEMHNTLQNFTMTSSLAVFAFAFQSGLREVFLLPMIVIVPAIWRIAYYRSATIKISSYIAARIEPTLEGLDWESALLREARAKKTKARWSRVLGHAVDFFRFSDMLLMGLVSLGLYVFLPGSEGSHANHAFALVGLIMLALVACGTVACCAPSESRLAWFEKWRRSPLR